jgi:hypothetical protein
VTFTAVDKYGNAVDLGASDDDITITQTGSGYLTSTPAVFTKGVAQTVLILQANDTGSATLRIVAALDTSIATDNITKSATITVGTAPAAAGSTVARIAGSTNRFFVGVDGNTLARNVVVRVAGRSFATLKGSATNRSYAVRAPKGSHKVTVFVGGRLIATKTITVR